MNLTTVNLMEFFTRILIIFLILPVHEYAHAWAAHKLGDETAAYSGRLTMNPLAHIDIFGALCLFLTGFGWAKPVPINPVKFKKQRLGTALTAAAGPASNLLVAIIALIIYRIITVTTFFRNGLDDLYKQFTNIDDILSQPLMASSLEKSANGINYMYLILIILEFFILINIGLAIFNLIPIPPLDGSKILGYFTSYKFDMWIQKNYMIVNFIFMFIILSGALSTPLGWIRNIILDGLWFATKFIPMIAGV